MEAVETLALHTEANRLHDAPYLTAAASAVRLVQIAYVTMREAGK